MFSGSRATYIKLFAGFLLYFPVFATSQVQKGDSLKYLKREHYQSDNARRSRLDQLVDSAVSRFMRNPVNSAISIGVSQRGNSHFYNYGEIRKGNGQLPDRQTVYETGALTTTFCGLLLANAVQENKIRLEEDIRTYLPGEYPQLVFGKHPVLVKHLATHTSGLPRIPEDLDIQPGYDSLNPYKHYTRNMILTYLKTVKPVREPGTICEYGIYGIALLGIILENVYGMPFDVLVKSKISGAAGLRSTPAERELTTNRAQGYNMYGDSTVAWDLGGFEAAGGLSSTAEDLLLYLDYNKAEKDAATRLAHKITFSGRETLGLTWFIKTTKQGNTLVWHNGGTYGFTGFIGYIKEKDCAVIILANSATQLDYIGIAILNYLQK